MDKKQAYICEVVTYLSSGTQSSRVTSIVNDLVKDGYEVKVTVHEPIHVVIQKSEYNEVQYVTTIEAWLK